MSLDLSFPAKRGAPPRELEIRPKQVKAWIESLPLAQSMDASRKLCANLAAMNSSKIDWDDRVQILETYRPTTAVLLEELEAIFAKSTPPLAVRAREALGVARDLAAELAVGYKIAIAEKSGKLLAFGSPKQLPLLIYRAMECLAAGLRASYKSYSPVPAGIWKEMHQLYLHAERENLALALADAEAKASVFDAYSESLLLALTDPYRLIQGEAEKVLAQIRAARGLATLARARPSTPPGAHFLVPCDTDRPPKPALSANDDTGGENWRLLDANPLVERLRARKKALETGNVSATTSRMVGADGMALLEKLIVLWGDPPKRSSRRDAMETTVAICVGLKDLSHFVSCEPKGETLSEGEGIRSGITMPLITVPDDEVSKQLAVHEWDVVNQSAGGLKVRRLAAARPSIGVGEVVGIKSIGKSRWTIGVVRWITELESGALEFGLQFLSPGARTVSVLPTAVSIANQAKLALLLAEGESFGEQSLLTPPSTFADLREFEVEDEGMVSCVRATRLIEKTLRFELFHFSPS